MPKLVDLQVTNLALIRQANVSFGAGFHVLTGESGAGKSLLLQALSLALGGRTDSDLIRSHEDKLSVTLQVTELSQDVEKWLHDQGLEQEDELIIRRQVLDTGRSAAWVNGTKVSLTELKRLAELLCVMGLQHSQLQVLDPHYIQDWYDRVAGLSELAQTTAKHKKHYAQLLQQQLKAKEHSAQQQARFEELTLFIEELGSLSQDYHELETRHEYVSSIGELITATQNVTALLNDSEPAALTLLSHAKKAAEGLTALNAVSELIDSALESLNEATKELSRIDVAEVSTEEFLELESMLASYHKFAKKHGCKPGELLALLEAFEQEHSALEASMELSSSAKAVEGAKAAWETSAAQLFEARSAKAQQLATQLKDTLTPLAMPEVQVEFSVQKPIDLSSTPLVAFEFAANKGMDLKPLDQTASGGELSRVSLVMQLMDSGSKDTRMMVFDEIDSGLSGAAAQSMGDMLYHMAKQRQILAISHQPQVAACASGHFLVEKDHSGELSASSIKLLSGDQRVHELARMAGGHVIDQTTLDHAKALLHAQPN